ncbi:MAG: CbiX/SirB N-terminal domain-containing protein [Candidatus Omnitrophota bacterium]|nr:CbiX/SirB N-terminal domain-containing protein [Candidatus Omnitrophota bacterium]
MIKRVNKACKFFPCHTSLEDCTFCYCPFYPCLNRKRGEYVYSPKNDQAIWSCKSCAWIHRVKVVDDIFGSIRENRYRKKSLKDRKAGIIILSHGSKLKKANTSLNKTIRVIRQKTGLDTIVPAYLQFCQPDLEKSIKNFITKGHQTIIIIPFFLFNGNHVTRDIPHIIEKEKEKYPNVKFMHTKNIGEDTRISDIVSDMVEEAVQSGSTY